MFGCQPATRNACFVFVHRSLALEVALSIDIPPTLTCKPGETFFAPALLTADRLARGVRARGGACGDIVGAAGGGPFGGAGASPLHSSTKASANGSVEEASPRPLVECAH